MENNELNGMQNTQMEHSEANQNLNSQMSYNDGNQSSNKKGISLPIKVTIIGCIIALIFAGIGGFKQLNAKKTNDERAATALKESEDAVKNANERLAEIEKEYNNLKTQYEAKENECDSITMGSENWIQAKSKCSREAQELQSKLWDLESEDKLIKSKDYTVYYQKVEPMSYLIYYIIGGSIVGLSLLASFIIYLVKGKKTY